MAQRPTHCILYNVLFSTKAFLTKLLKNFEEQAEDFFQRHKRQFSTKPRPSSVNLTKPLSSKLQRLKRWSNPISLTLLLFVIPIHCENSSYSLKVYLRAHNITLPILACFIFFLYGISLLVLLKFVWSIS